MVQPVEMEALATRVIVTTKQLFREVREERVPEETMVVMAPLEANGMVVLQGTRACREDVAEEAVPAVQVQMIAFFAALLAAM